MMRFEASGLRTPPDQAKAAEPFGKAYANGWCDGCPAVEPGEPFTALRELQGGAAAGDSGSLRDLLIERCRTEEGLKELIAWEPTLPQVEPMRPEGGGDG